mgnify:CR=1 FL=1
MPRVTWITLKTIKLKCGGNAQLLYLEYLDVANQQETNQPWATNSWVAGNMGVGIDWVKEARARLIKEGFVETVAPVWNKVKQRFENNYIKINKIVTKKKILSSLSLTSGVLTPVSAGGVLPLVEKQHHICLKDNERLNLKDNDKTTAFDESIDSLSSKDTTVEEKDNAPTPTVTVSKESAPVSTAGAESTPVDINKTIALWETVNPLGFKKFFANKTQRQSVVDSIKVLGLEEYTKSLEQIAISNKEGFAPQINTPYNFQLKYQQWLNYMSNKRSGEEIPDGMHFSVEKQKDVWYEGGKIIAEYENDLQWQTFLRTKGENFVIPEKPADGIGYQPMSYEERIKKIKTGEIKQWDF